MNSPQQFPMSGGLPEGDLRMLAAMRHGLQTSVAQEVKSVMSKTITDFTIQYLDKLIIKHTEWPAIFRRQIRRQGAIALKVANRLNETRSIPAEFHATAIAVAARATAMDESSLAEMEQIQCDIDALLEKLLPVLMNARTRVQTGSTEQANALLQELVATIRDSEQDFNLALQQRAETHARKAESGVAITAEAIQAYLRQRFPERKNIEVVSFNELIGGSSKSTILVDVRGLENDGVTPLVFRLDRVAGSTDTRVVNEVPTLQTVFRKGFPVPELLWSEPDASRLGLAFVVVRKVDAPLGGNMWQPDPQLCNADTARDLARILAKLHTMDTTLPEAQGAIRLDPAVHPVQGLIDNIRGLWALKKLEPDAMMEACLCWLEENMPPAPARLSLIHADVSFHNLLVKDGKIASLLDWELSHLGDPAEDLSYARPCIEQLMPWNEFLAEYRKHGGGEYSEETGSFYAVWRGVRNGVYTLASQHSFHTGANLDFRWGFFATYYRMVLLEAAERIAKAGLRPA